MYQKTIDLARVSGGRMMGEIDVDARYWETRYSWGHSAEVTMGLRTLGAAKIRYYNRTWESYTFQSVLHSALCAYVKGVTGIDPYMAISKRDSKQMKSAAAEMRRLHRLDAIHYARGLYDNLCAAVDGKAEMPHRFTGAELAA